MIQDIFECNVQGTIVIKRNKSSLEEIYSFSDLERNELFKKMHIDILNQQSNICNFQEGLSVMDTIYIIQEQNYE